MPVRTYDPKSVQIIVGVNPMGGFADGTFATVAYENDAFTKISGADGDVSRSKSNDSTGTLTLTLAQTSPSNDVLTAVAIADRTANNGIVPIAVKDLSGRSTYVSAFGWIRKQPDSEYAKEITNREWILDLADLDMFNGGNAATE